MTPFCFVHLILISLVPLQNSQWQFSFNYSFRRFFIKKSKWFILREIIFIHLKITLNGLWEELKIDPFNCSRNGDLQWISEIKSKNFWNSDDLHFLSTCFLPFVVFHSVISCGTASQALVHLPQSSWHVSILAVGNVLHSSLCTSWFNSK